MKISKLYTLLLAGLLIFLASTAYISFDKKSFRVDKIFADKQQDNKGIIKFNHAKHVKDNGMQCKDCHLKAVTSAKTGENLNPKHSDCSSCHDVNSKKDCNLCHYDGVYKKLESSDRGIIFSHKFHTETGKMQCTDCHTGLDKVKLSGESAGSFPNMEKCYSCHNNKTATNNCEACHKNLTTLKPKDHLVSNFLNEHKVISDVEKGNNSKNCMMCHSDNFCQACHSAGKYNGSNQKNDFYAPYYSKENGVRTERAALQKLNNVHELNYLYTHGLDANHKGFECKTCHDAEQFCSACHQNGGNTLTGIAPKNHLEPNFKTFGVNTGGGLHADLARRDIESCQSCHSSSGADPVCVKCHFDNDGMKGTNPKTHERGFLSDEKGIWHDTPGAICYTCHTDANAKPNGVKGMGFCGYCHK